MNEEVGFGRGLGRRALCLGTSVVLAVSLVPLPAFAQGEPPADAGDEAFAPAGDAPSFAAQGEVECAPGEILVQYDDAGESRYGGLSLDLMESQLSTMAGLEVAETVVERGEAHGTVVKAEVPEGTDPADAAARAEQVPGVSHAQPNYVYHLMEGVPAMGGLTAGAIDAAAGDDAAAATNDTFLAQQYFLGSWEEEHGADVLEAWKSVKADATAAENNAPVVTVAVLDTGVYANHLDLKDQIWEDYLWDAFRGGEPGKDNFLDKQSNPTGDIVGHGTHVCGIAAATANNQQGIAGASYNAKLLPIKVFNDSSYQAYAKTEWIYKAYDYLLSDRDGNGKTVAEETNTHVVNMSLGGYGKEGEIDDLLEEKIEEAAAADIITVCAGGNGDDQGNPITRPSWPSDYDACVSVTCLSAAGTNTYWSDFNEFKDISAPGVDILSTYNDKENSYTKMTGTSMASPLVAGIAALLFSADPGLSVDEAKEALYSTVNELDPKGQNYRKPIRDGEEGGVTGSPGCVDAAAAVEAVLQSSSVKRVKIQECSAEGIADQLFTGRAVEPEISISHGSGDEAKALVKDVDYRVQFKDNVNVGKASATIIGIGAYVGRITVDFNIKFDFSKATVLTDKEGYVATGKALEPAVHVALGGRLLRAGSDYVVKYRENTSVGTAFVDVTGAGDYLGEVTETFEITAAGDKPEAAGRRDLSKVGVAAIANQVYQKGKALKPSPKLTDYRGAALKSGVDYKLTYQNNAKAGYAHVTAKAAGDTWSGRTDAYFRILAAAPSFKDVKGSTKFASDIKMAARLGLMSGKSGKFNASGSFTRGEAAVLLYALAGKPKVPGKTVMSDVKPSASNYKALQWACANGMLSTTGGKAQAGKAITQQDLANMLYRFGVLIGHGDMTVGASKFFSAADRAKVSAADRVGVAWAAEKGALMLTTSKGKKLLNPTAPVTRGMAAHMLVTACDAIYQPGKAVKAADDALASVGVAKRVLEGMSDATVAVLESEAVAVAEAEGEAIDEAAEPTSQAGALEAQQGDFVYSVVDGEIFVSGYKGGETKGSSVEVPAEVSRLKVGDEIVSGPVKGIAADAFSKSPGLRKVTISPGIESIGSRAFYGCDNLVSVSIPEGVTSIGDSAFAYCSSLGKIELPASLARLGEQAFTSQALTSIGVAKDSTAFSSVNGVLFSADKKTLVCYPMGRAYGTYKVPEGTVAIAPSAFHGVASASNKPLANVELPDGLESIGAHAFEDADGVTGLKVPGSVVSIGEYAFSGMDALKSLVLPAGLEEIPAGFAQRSLKLVDFKLPASVKTIGEGAFRETNIWGISLPEGLTSIGAYAFAGCKKMEGLSLPTTLEAIGDYAFQNCTSVTHVDLSNTLVTAVGAGAFAGDAGIASVEIPTRVETLGAKCFWGCTSLSSVKFADSADAACRLTEIPANAFTNNPIESLVLPASVASVGAAAFAGNGSLERVVVQNRGAWSMADDAFDQTNPSVVYGYRGSSTWKHFAADKLRSIDIENDLPLAGVCRVADDGVARLRTLVVSESGFVSLQWRKDGVDVPGANGGVLAVKGVDAGTYTLVATSDLDPTHPVEFSVKVSAVGSLPIAIEGASVEVADAAYTGKPVAPAVSVAYDGAALVEGVDYKVDYSGNVKAGTGAVTVTGIGEFAGAKTAPFAIVAQPAAFADVKSGWFVSPVREAAMRGLMQGATATAFKPSANATRGQVAAALYRVANPGKSASEADALKWAVSKKVFAKAGSASAAITHQDLAVALLAFAKARGIKTTGASAAAFLELSDFNSIAKSARTACIFTSCKGILGTAGDGKAKKFLPAGKTTRAELARAVVALDDLI